MPNIPTQQNSQPQPFTSQQTSTTPPPPRQFKMIGIYLLLVLALVFLPSIPTLGGKIISPQKVDDWQYQHEPTNQFDLMLSADGVGEFLTQLVSFIGGTYQGWSIRQRLVFWTVASLITLLPFGWRLLHYRVWLKIINLFRKDKLKGERTLSGWRSLAMMVGGLVSIGLAVALIYFDQTGRGALGLTAPAVGALIFNLLLIAIIPFVSVVYCLVLLVKKMQTQEPSRKFYGKKLGKTASVLIPTYKLTFLLPAIVFFAFTFANNFLGYGGGLQYTTPPTSGGGLSGSSSVRPYGNVSKSAPLSVSEMALPSTGGGAAGVFGGGASSMADSETIGYAVGGAKDVNNFRSNVENDFLPLPTDITHHGLFYDYYFETGRTEICDILFCPTYSYAVSKDPISDETEKYLSVGLNSNIKKADFERKKLNVVIVLDISGSMSSSFRRYYYDRFTNNPSPTKPETDSNKSKMQVASESVVALLDHLNEDDRFGMVLFDNSAYTAKPLRKLRTTDLPSIKNHILEISPRGGTNMEAGYKRAVSLLEKYEYSDKSEYENRIIFLTDAQPNTGALSEDSLVGMTRSNADDGIYSTFIGVGVDFNTELTEALTKIKGANYYAVHSPSEFKKRMDDGFEYMVTPLVFDLKLVLDSDDYDIAAVYGSPEADKATGQIMYVNTLFPSDSQQGQVKGGIILLKLDPRQTGDDEARTATLKVSYQDRQGKRYERQEVIALDGVEPPYFDHGGIRKAVLLSRYANLAKNWIKDERAQQDQYKTIQVIEQPSVNFETGIEVLPDQFNQRQLSQWERTSLPLKVHSPYDQLFAEFNNYFQAEKQALEDATLDQEQKVLDKLIQAGSETGSTQSESDQQQPTR